MFEMSMSCYIELCGATSLARDYALLHFFSQFDPFLDYESLHVHIYTSYNYRLCNELVSLDA